MSSATYNLSTPINDDGDTEANFAGILIGKGASGLKAMTMLACQRGASNVRYYINGRGARPHVVVSAHTDNGVAIALAVLKDRIAEIKNPPVFTRVFKVPSSTAIIALCKRIKNVCPRGTRITHTDDTSSENHILTIICWSDSDASIGDIKVKQLLNNEVFDSKAWTRKKKKNTPTARANFTALTIEECVDEKRPRISRDKTQETEFPTLSKMKTSTTTFSLRDFQDTQRSSVWNNHKGPAHSNTQVPRQVQSRSTEGIKPSFVRSKYSKSLYTTTPGDPSKVEPRIPLTMNDLVPSFTKVKLPIEPSLSLNDMPGPIDDWCSCPAPSFSDEE